MAYFKELHNAISCLHYNYGKGDIRAIRQFADGRIEIDAQRTSCGIHTTRGHAVQKGNNKTVVRMYRHQLTVNLRG